MLAALDEIGALDGVRLVARSSLWRSAPVDAAGDDYVNAVALVERRSTRRACCASCRRSSAGRAGAPHRNAPRTLDLDLLLHDDAPAPTATLTLPHPRLHERAFVLLPMVEIAPGLEVPRAGPAAALLQALGAPPAG